MADVIKTVHGGHGGKNDFDPGAVSAYGREVDMAREISQLILNRTGAVNTSDSVGTTVNQNLANIAQNINRVANDSSWNLSIHMNSATPSATGVEVFAFGGDSAGMAKASQISKAIANVLGIPDRGAKDGSGLYDIRNTKGHTLLIEVGFVSNANDVAQIRAKKEQVADAIVACFSGGSTPTPKPNPQSGKQIKVIGLTPDMQRLFVPQFQQKYAYIYLASKIHGFAKGGIELNSIPNGKLEVIYNSLIKDFKIPVGQVKKLNSNTIHVIGLADDTQINWVPQFQKKYAGIYLAEDINGNFTQTVELNNIPNSAEVIRKSLAEDFKIPTHQIR